MDTVIFPYMILPILLETLFVKEKKFHVTNKERTAGKKSDFQLAIPHILLLVLDGYALFLFGEPVQAGLMTISRMRPLLGS